MKYFYKHSRAPVEAPNTEINAAAGRLHQKLLNLKLGQLGISEYNKRYLGKRIKNPLWSLQLYTHILSLALQGQNKPLRETTLIDYGGGSGMLSLLAKETGIGTVIYNDIYDVSCSDIERTSKALDIHIDGIVCGDIDELVDHVSENGISVDTMASYDVIEHIYDIEGYLRRLSALSKPPTRFVFGSGANIKNPYLSRQIAKIHSNCEFKDREAEWGSKKRDDLRSYLSLRKDIVRKYKPSLSDQEVEHVAQATRGLIAADIEKCVDEYAETGKITYTPDHPSNTCDPNTGNWAEHLIDADWLKRILEQEGFRTEILSGYYPSTGSRLRRTAKHALNIGIRLLGSSSLPIAPCYIICADQTK